MNRGGFLLWLIPPKRDRRPYSQISIFQGCLPLNTAGRKESVSRFSTIHAGSRRTPQPGPNLPVVTHYPRFLIRQGLKSDSFRSSWNHDHECSHPDRVHLQGVTSCRSSQGDRRDRLHRSITFTNGPLWTLTFHIYQRQPKPHQDPLLRWFWLLVDAQTHGRRPFQMVYRILRYHHDFTETIRKTDSRVPHIWRQIQICMSV